ncbi:cobyrinic acid a,c-diamide synthase [Flavobacterium covae]|uniref:Cobyrinate a,c-diamide synthase n=1 Tax=Flavobacterium covae TaxID=2906076 RepID=A0ABW8PGM7_9FLAO|nr:MULTISPECIES: cobyrinate a,c-diamide synthase [Flavobacterium]OXA83110.1 cobyrinic acid a,c-diamide synthase [Flavobacterium columnare NBRC 100251 = ATCC 23463]AND64972.1 cobyrinic acid a,c-diamide synthase [Flavobacterium covae]MCJ1807185.1 cobyrinate a,c-diamide synthase [Flavobacterium covae]OWP80905.1 cobyrinic acid a,c-diamide synthase [Flavobacterium covae]OWP86137.1 cobyrinic acid a,c-diamide synthase [Flavobacterium covae]
MKPQFLIAAPSSNSGKTTITLGLLRLLKNNGYKVQPFKCGPDYIDTKHHTKAAGEPSINLDTYMMSESHVKTLYKKYSQEADISIIEGVMGLFDGANRMEGSSAEIALLLNIPIILVVNAKSMAYSVAPLLFGLKNFNPKIKIAGVIFNFVNTESHYSFLKEACNDVGIEALGYIPSNTDITIPSRHLGLFISPEHDYELIIENAAKHLAKSIDINRILEISNTENHVFIPKNIIELKTETNSFFKDYTIAVAHDNAFNFTYFENIKGLENLGKIIYFSPITDNRMPKADILYLAGGYPELYLKDLANNISMRKSILDFCSNGGKVIAECGGMMYLGNQIINSEGIAYPMVGFLPIETSMEKAKLSLGYREIKLDNQIIKGHEFHYSKIIEKEKIPTIGQIFNAKGIEIATPIYRLKNVIASYIHFYWGDSLLIINFLNKEDLLFDF